MTKRVGWRQAALNLDKCLCADYLRRDPSRRKEAREFYRGARKQVKREMGINF